MAKITSKLQVTIPKAIAEQYAMHPGDEIEFVPAGEVIRVVPHAQRGAVDDIATRLRIFDKATERQRSREPATRVKKSRKGRGWTREDLYGRGRSR